MTGSRELAIEHLSLLHVSPPDLVRVAAHAGFDAVGVRVFHPQESWNPWPMLGPSPLMEATARLSADLGVRVLSIETLSLTPGLRRGDYEAVLEAGARLRARFLNVIGDDPDLGRARETFAILAAAAAEYGLRPALEPIFHRPVSSLEDALGIVEGSSGAVQVDVLHFHRMGSTLERLRSIDPKLLSYLQVDDAPAAAPETVELRRHESRSGRLLPGDGELAIVPVVEAMPAGTPLSLEVSAPLNTADPAAFALAGYHALVRVLTDADRAERPETRKD